MSLPPETSRTRLVTVFGTVLYCDEPTGALRHGAAAHSPQNLSVAGDGQSLASSRHAWLLQETVSGPRPIATKLFEIEPLPEGGLGLRADGLYLCAEIDGRAEVAQVHASEVITTRPVPLKRPDHPKMPAPASPPAPAASDITDWI